MSLFLQLLALTIAMLLMFFAIRGVIMLHIDASLTKRSRQKLRKNQSFRECFFYKRYLNILPKGYLIWYFANMVAYLICFVSVICLYINGEKDVSASIIWIYFFINASILLFSRIMHL